MVEKRSRLGIGNPLVKEYIIASVFISEKNPNVTICKYIVPQKKGDSWEEVVRTQFVENPEQIDLTGQAIKITTEIV